MSFLWKFLIDVSIFLLNTTNIKNPHRWVLLRHTGAPDDLRGMHFDLLIEDQDFCRTWRLSDIPELNGPYVDSVSVAHHNLYWLDVKEKVVSGGRGFATRVKKGVFFNSTLDIDNCFINLSLIWEDVKGHLVINENGCRIFSN